MLIFSSFWGTAPLGIGSKGSPPVYFILTIYVAQTVVHPK
jgi:hypothetical protein